MNPMPVESPSTRPVKAKFTLISQRGKELSHRFLELGLYLVLCISPFLFGCGFYWGYTLLEAAVLFIGAGLVFYYVFFPDKNQQGKKVNLLLLLLAAWAGFIAFQLLPLPESLVQIISPRRVQLLETYGFPELLKGNPVTLSLGTYSARMEVGKLFSYTALVFIAYFIFRDKMSLRRFCLVVAFIGMALSLTGILFHRFDNRKVYGILTFAQSFPLTPYLNKNHFANYLVMTIPMTLAALMLSLESSSWSQRDSIREKIVWFSTGEALGTFLIALIFSIQCFALLMTTSRGGALAFVISMLCFSGFLLYRRTTRIFLFAVLAVITLGVLVAMPQIPALLDKINQLKVTGIDIDYAKIMRLSNWENTLRIFFDFPIWGIGAGGFAELFPYYKRMPERNEFDQVDFFHAENDPLQGLAELGVVGWSLLAIFLIRLIGLFIKNWRGFESKTLSWVSLGCVTAGIGMLVHSGVDFPTHIPANMALFSVLGGVTLRMLSDPAMPKHRMLNVSSSAPICSRPLRTAMGISLGFVLIFALVPVLSKQWISEMSYSQAKAILAENIGKENPMTLSSLFPGYTALLKAKRLGSDQQARIDFELARIYAYFGLSDRQVGRFPQSEAWFQKAESSALRTLELWPLSAAYHYRLAWIYLRWGKTKNAERYLKHAVELHPSNAFYAFQFGKYKLENHDDEEGAMVLMKQAYRISTRYRDMIPELLHQFYPDIPLETFVTTMKEAKKNDVFSF